ANDIFLHTAIDSDDLFFPSAIFTDTLCADARDEVGLIGIRKTMGILFSHDNGTKGDALGPQRFRQCTRVDFANIGDALVLQPFSQRAYRLMVAIKRGELAHDDPP